MKNKYYIFLIISILILIFYILNKDVLTNSFILLIITIFVNIISILLILNQKFKFIKHFIYYLSIIFLIFLFLIVTNTLNLEKNLKNINFNDKVYTKAITWSKNNNVKLKQSFEYSDSVEENKIISSNFKNNILDIIISLGPNYDKEVILKNLVGEKLEKVVKLIKENHLNNIDIDFIENDYKEEILLEQSIVGQFKRNDKIKFVFSKIKNNQDYKLKDLVNKTLLDSTIELKRNGIPFSLEYDYNNIIKANKVIKTNKKTGDTNIENLVLTISKGNKIITPEFTKMNFDEVSNFILKNKLKLNFIEKYSDKVKKGNIISSSVKKGDTLGTNDLVDIVVSKGELKMINYSSLNQIQEFAEINNIELEIIYQENNQINPGELIKVSKQPGELIIDGEKISVYISEELKIKIPNFKNLTKDEAEQKCNQEKLKCEFIGKEGIVTNQNIEANKKVKQNTTIILTITKKEESINDKKQSSILDLFEF